MKLFKLFLIYQLCSFVNSYSFNNIINYNIQSNKNTNCDYNTIRRNVLYTGLGLSLLPKNAYAKNLLNYMEEKQKELYDTTVPSVCYISTEYTNMGEKFNINKDGLPKGVGTGFVWDNNGHIITNFHVINKVDNAVTITKKFRKSII